MIESLKVHTVSFSFSWKVQIRNLMKVLQGASALILSTPRLDLEPRPVSNLESDILTFFKMSSLKHRPTKVES